jgi:hypothetical protein
MPIFINAESFYVLRDTRAKRDSEDIFAFTLPQPRRVLQQS